MIIVGCAVDRCSLLDELDLVLSRPSLRSNPLGWLNSYIRFRFYITLVHGDKGVVVVPLDSIVYSDVLGFKEVGLTLDEVVGLVLDYFHVSSENRCMYG